MLNRRRLPWTSSTEQTLIATARTHSDTAKIVELIYKKIAARTTAVNVLIRFFIKVLMHFHLVLINID